MSQSMEIVTDEQVPEGEVWMVPNLKPLPGETQPQLDARRAKGTVRLVNVGAPKPPSVTPADTDTRC